MRAEMKILGTFFRLLCALIVLLALAIYLNGPLQVSLADYLAAFTPEHIQSLADADSWLAIAAGALLLLTLCCGLKLGWNIVYSLATLVFFTEAALMALGPDVALPSAIRGLGWEPALRELALNYPVAALMIPALCILGCLCASAPVRIAWTSLLSCALCYGCAELLYLGLLHWQTMPEPFLPSALATVQAFPWVIVALPAVFFVQYSLFMAMFETFVPRKKKAREAEAVEEKSEEKATPTPAPEEAKPTKPTATVPVAARPVVVKRPVIHKKSPVSPAPETKNEEENGNKEPESAPETAKAEEAPTPETPAPAPEAEANKAEATLDAQAESAPETEASDDAAPKPKATPEAEEAPKA